MSSSPTLGHAGNGRQERASLAVLYTSKSRERCPDCGGRKLIRKGTRRKKLEVVQLWRCTACGRVFTPAPPALRNKTYPLRVILEALTLGSSLADVARQLKTRRGVRVPPSTLSTWIAEHRDLTTYARLREEGRRRYSPRQTIQTTKLYHRQVYEYAYHRPKFAFLRESREHARFAAVADFLESVPKACPHDLFTESARASQTAPAFLDRARLSAVEKENFATRMAALVIPSVGDNYRRHETLQRFMLANDFVTLAVEVPIWLASRDIAALEREHGIPLLPDGAAADQTITGHIDFLQIRNGAVHILDYKPGARADRPFAQLTIHALALTRLVPGLRLFDIKCAWFDEEQYCEFFPRTALARSSRR